jgi:hypothetical protein
VLPRGAVEVPAGDRAAGHGCPAAATLAISAMVDLFKASELHALASLAATPEGGSALARLPALGAVRNPIVERQIDDAARNFRER